MDGIRNIDANLRDEMKGVCWQDSLECPGFDDLRVLDIPFKNLQGQHSVGEMVVHVSVALEVLEIFKEIKVADFRIESVLRIESFKGDDDKSMAANNSSAFNFRTIDGKDRLSAHAKGLAVDINPRWNPWIRGNSVAPSNAHSFVDRDQEHPGIIKADGAVVNAFCRRGWIWGGDWKESKDYHHFQKG